jgi:hypothetical protein
MTPWSVQVDGKGAIGASFANVARRATAALILSEVHASGR